MHYFDHRRYPSFVHLHVDNVQLSATADQVDKGLTEPVCEARC